MAVKLVMGQCGGPEVDVFGPECWKRGLKCRIRLGLLHDPMFSQSRFLNFCLCVDGMVPPDSKVVGPVVDLLKGQETGSTPPKKVEIILWKIAQVCIKNCILFLCLFSRAPTNITIIWAILGPRKVLEGTWMLRAQMNEREQINKTTYAVLETKLLYG